MTHGETSAEQDSLWAVVRRFDFSISYGITDDCLAERQSGAGQRTMDQQVKSITFGMDQQAESVTAGMDH